MNGLILYIDPGTGSMLFTIIIGAVSAGFFVLQKLKLKLKFVLSGGKAQAADLDKIPFVIFSDNKRYWNVFKPVCDEFEKRGVDIQYWTMSPDDPVLSSDYDHVKGTFIGEGNRAFSKLNTMNASIVLSTTPGLDVLQWKRSKNVDLYIHILHQPGNTTFYRMFGIDHYDTVLISGDYQEKELRELEKMRNLKSRDLVLTGVTYLDAMMERYEKEKDSATDSSTRSDLKTVLLAPTWGETAILSKFGEKIISALIDTGYNIIIRPHPQSFTSEKELMDRLLARFPETEKLHWNRDNDNFDVLKNSDIMITDFSSVMFDYALIFDRPFIYADIEFDKSPYDAAWFEEDMWCLRILPSIGIPLKEEDFGRIREVIDNTVNSDSLANGRQKARHETWSNPGQAAVITADYMLKKYSDIAEEKAAVTGQP